MTLLPNPPEFVRKELGEAMRLGAREYWIVNCSNIKPHVYLLDYLAALWREGDMEPQQHRMEYCARYYGQENAKRVADCFAAYYAHALSYGRHEDERAGEQFGNHGARMLVSQWMNDASRPAEGLRWATDARRCAGRCSGTGTNAKKRCADTRRFAGPVRQRFRISARRDARSLRTV